MLFFDRAIVLTQVEERSGVPLGHDGRCSGQRDPGVLRSASRSRSPASLTSACACHGRRRRPCLAGACLPQVSSLCFREIISLDDEDTR